MTAKRQKTPGTSGANGSKPGSNRKPPPAAGAACARARKLREERVDHVLKLMTKGAWHTRRYRELQAKWGVGYDAVKDYAREASGILRYCVLGDPESVRAALIAGIESLRVRCRSRKRVHVTATGPVSVPDPDLKTELAAYELQLRTLGLIVERVQDVPPDGLPNDVGQLRELAREELAKAESGE